MCEVWREKHSGMLIDKKMFHKTVMKIRKEGDNMRKEELDSNKKKVQQLI